MEDRPINHLESQLITIIRKYSGGNPYQTVLLSQITADDLKTFNQKVLESILDEYLGKEDGLTNLFSKILDFIISHISLPNLYTGSDTPKSADFVRLRWFLRRLTQVGHPGAIDFCLNNLKSLTPALADVCHYLFSASANYDGDCAALGERLFNALSNEVICSSEYFQLCVMSLFSRNGNFNHFSQLIKLFDKSSGNIRREIILSARSCNGADWLRELKEMYPSMDIWCKQAFLVSAKSLPFEERTFFVKSLTKSSILDEILLEWIKAR